MASFLYSGLAGFNRDSKGNKKVTILSHSNKNLLFCSFLLRRGWIRNYNIGIRRKKRVIFVFYKYNSHRNCFFEVRMLSSFGNRNYCTYRQLVHLCRNTRQHTYYILSTSKGFLSSHEALSIGIGGELICRIVF